MKNRRLNLEELRVKSFITSSKDVNAKTIKGGISTGDDCIDQTCIPPLTLLVEKCKPKTDTIIDGLGE